MPRRNRKLTDEQAKRRVEVARISRRIQEVGIKPKDGVTFGAAPRPNRSKGKARGRG